MPNTYHPPTRTVCPVCEELLKNDSRRPIISTYNGKSSSSNGYPFHDWYNFVLGYTPSFPEYMIKREGINSNDIVLDPFAGSGTTQLVCKLNKIKSFGIDANDFMIYAAKMKLNWEYDVDTLKLELYKLMASVKKSIRDTNFSDKNNLKELANKCRPDGMEERYITDRALVLLDIIKSNINLLNISDNNKKLFLFALSSILVEVSNIRYGPGFGVIKRKEEADVANIYYRKMLSMIYDLESVSEEQKRTSSESLLGDSRYASKYIDENSISLIITSPPYPGDHEYTKHSKLELIFEGMANNLKEFQVIKKRMLVSSTTNVYKDSNDKECVLKFDNIKEITDEIEKRLILDGATSGFEKLYTKLIWEYYGGMYKTLSELYKVLKPGGKIALLISDSHAFKMVHIKTAEHLRDIGVAVGYINPEIELWQMKNSTSHRYQIRENILILQKPTNKN